MGKRILALVLALLLALAMVPFAVSADTEANIVYIASTGNDENDGLTKDTAFLTIAKAYESLGDAGGTIVVTDAVKLWSKAVTKEHPHTGMVTLTGKDPATGEIYEKAQLLHNAVGFHGPTTLEYLTINSFRTYAYMNTCGNEVIFGEGLKYGDNGIKFYVHDGIGESYGFTSLVPSTNTTVNSGEFLAYYLGGGYPRPETEGGEIKAGVAGDIRFTQNGGVVGLTIGFDKYNSGNGYIHGNVFITINGGSLSFIRTANIADNTIDGACQIILNNNIRASVAYPAAKGGNYIIYGSQNGVISQTDKIGVFNVKSDKGFVATINGNEITDGDVEFKQGENEVVFVRKHKVDVKVSADSAYIKGYEDQTFRPQNNMTRAEAVTIISRLISDEDSIKGAYVSEFSDVEKDAWYYDYIAFLENIGVLNSYSGQFLPNQNITRAEFVELIYNISANDDSGATKLAAFSDVAIDNPRFYEISFAVSNVLVKGYPDGTFLPDGNITRAEVVTVINRFLKRVPTGNSGENSYGDIDDHWAKGQIIAASNRSVSNVNGADVAVWTTAAEDSAIFTIPESAKSAKDYINALYEADKTLKPSEIVKGADLISQRMKQDVLSAKDELKATGTTYYVSNKGNDENDGKTPETAWATLTKANSPITVINPTGALKPGDAVLFERGGMWRGQLLARDGVSYGAYGEGAKPILNGSDRNYADPSLWIETETKNIYKFTGKIGDVGLIALNYTGEIGKYDEEVAFKEFVGLNSFKVYADLNKDLSFYSNLDTNDLYFYSAEGNPGSRFKSLEIGQRRDIIECTEQKKDITIDNLHLTLGGAHGVGFGTSYNLNVQNCLFNWIGGSLLFNNTAANTAANTGGNVAGYGNAIEVYGGCDGFYANNNWVYQIFDTGITHQYASSGGGNCYQKNISFQENLVEYCHWSIEFYNAPVEGTERTVNNVYHAYNVLNNGGYGWGSIIRNRGSSATLFNSFRQDPRTENYVAEKNIFNRCAGYILRLNTGGDEKIQFKNNIYIQNEFKGLGYMFEKSYTYDVRARATLDALTKEADPILIYLK